jgi:hypothetical protein
VSLFGKICLCLGTFKQTEKLSFLPDKMSHLFMRALLDWLHFLPDKMSCVCEKAFLNVLTNVKMTMNDIMPSYMAESAAFAFYSALIQRQ